MGLVLIEQAILGQKYSTSARQQELECFLGTLSISRSSSGSWGAPCTLESSRGMETQNNSCQGWQYCFCAAGRLLLSGTCGLRCQRLLSSCSHRQLGPPRVAPGATSTWFRPSNGTCPIVALDALLLLVHGHGWHLSREVEKRRSLRRAELCYMAFYQVVRIQRQQLSRCVLLG